jgi:hypothetical protein
VTGLSALLLVALSVVGPAGALASSHHGLVTEPEFKNETQLIEAHEVQVEDFADLLGTQQAQCMQYEKLGENVKATFTKITLVEEGTYSKDQKSLLSAEKRWAEGLDSRAEAYKSVDDKKRVKNAGNDLNLSIAHAEDALGEEKMQAMEFSLFYCSDLEPLQKAEADNDSAHGKFTAGVTSLAAAVKSEH